MKTYAVLAAATGFLPWFLLPKHLRAEEPPPQRPLINLQFSGGSVADYVEALLKTAKDVNIVVMPEAREFKVPPLQLTGVDVGSAMELLNARTEPKGRAVVQLFVSEIEPFQGNGRAIFNVSATVGPPDAERPDEAGVWTVSDLLSADMKSQDVLTAIQTAVELISDQYGPAEIRFHEATGLVIARGHDRQIDVVEQVIKRLRDGRKSKHADVNIEQMHALHEAKDRINQLEGILNEKVRQLNNCSIARTIAEQQVEDLLKETSRLEAEVAELKAKAQKVAEFNARALESVKPPR